MTYLTGSAIFLRQAWRNNPIAPIALLLVCSLMFSCLLVVLRTLGGAAAGLQDNPLRDRIVSIRERDARTDRISGILEATYFIWSPQIKGLTHVAAAIDSESIRLNVLFPDGHRKLVHGGIAESALFPLFHISAKIGRIFSTECDQPQAGDLALLSLKVWSAEFNSDPGVIGKPLLINGRYYTILGVLDKDLPSMERIGIWVNQISNIEGVLNNGEHLHKPFTVFGALKPGVSPRDLESELKVYYSALAQDEPRRFAKTVPLVMPMGRFILARVETAISMLSYLGGIVIVLGVINALLLLTVRKWRLKRANNIRLLLGLPTSWLRTEYLLETGILALGGLAISIALNGMASRFVLPYLANGGIKLSSLTGADWRIAFVGWLLLVLFLSAPQFLTFQSKPTGRSRAALYALVLLETSVVATVLYLSGLTLRTISETQAESIRGYQANNLVAARYRTFGQQYTTIEGMHGFEERLLQSVKEVSNASDVGITTFLPLMDDNFVDYLNPSKNTEMDPNHAVEVMIVSSNYFDLFGVKFLAGAPFASNSQEPITIDSDAAKMIPCKAGDCVGKTVYTLNRPFIVTGVTQPVKFRHLQRQLPQVHIRSGNPARFMNQVAIVAKTSLSTGAMLPIFNEATARVDPAIVPLQIDSVAALVRESVEPVRRILNACILIGLLGLVASLVGVLVVTSQIIESQRRECGIRLALGETNIGVVKALCGPVLLWAAIGIVGGMFWGSLVQNKISAFILVKTEFDLQAAVGSGIIVAASLALGLIVPIRSILGMNAADLLRTSANDSGIRG